MWEWLTKIREYCDEHVQIALVANKLDLVKIDRSELDKLLKDDDNEYGSVQENVPSTFRQIVGLKSMVDPFNVSR